MDMFAVYAYAYHFDSEGIKTGKSASELPGSAANASKGVDWFFAIGVSMIAGLLVTVVSLVA